MNLQEIIQTLDLTLLTNSKDFTQIVPSGGYCADLLSCVMSGAGHQGIWITLQSHANIVAVAALLDLSAIIITEDAQPDPETIKKANEEESPSSRPKRNRTRYADYCGKLDCTNNQRHSWGVEVL